MYSSIGRIENYFVKARRHTSMEKKLESEEIMSSTTLMYLSRVNRPISAKKINNEREAKIRNRRNLHFVLHFPFQKQ